MNIKKTTGAVLAGIALAAASAAAAVPTLASAAPTRSCFQSSQWRGWSSPDPNTLLIRVGVRDVYRVELQGNRSRLKTPGRFLVNKVRGSNSVCSALDLNLSIADEHGFSTPLFPKNLVKLTPEEVTAIPKQYRP